MTTATKMNMLMLERVSLLVSTVVWSWLGVSFLWRPCVGFSAISLSFFVCCWNAVRPNVTGCNPEHAALIMA